MKKYLITGGSGFIGSNFIHHLLEHYQDILLVNLDKLTYAGNLENLIEVKDDPRYVFQHGDICDPILVSDLFNQYQFDVVVNFAAESHVDRSIESSKVFGQTNIMGTLNLLNCAKTSWEHGDEWLEGKRFVQISTDEVYGSLGDTGLFVEDSLIKPNNPYSASKAAADMLVMSYHHTYNVPVNITRCSNNYGPRQHEEKFMPLIIKQCMAKKPLPIYGDGLNVRDWIYVEDHCCAIDRVIYDAASGEIFNIGAYTEHTNIEVVRLIIETLNRTYNSNIDDTLINYVEDRKGHDWRYAMDSSKIQHILGWKPNTRFDEGIKATIEWYVDKYSKDIN